jgi:hypothetical protein
MPPSTSDMPIHVSVAWSINDLEVSQPDSTSINVPLDITLPSAHHSPKTVKRNASEFVIGTVSDNSVEQ